MKQTISWFLVFMIVFSCASLLRGLGCFLFGLALFFLGSVFIKFV